MSYHRMELSIMSSITWTHAPYDDSTVFNMSGNLFCPHTCQYNFRLVGEWTEVWVIEIVYVELWYSEYSVYLVKHEWIKVVPVYSFISDSCPVILLKL